jgi:hypothetical protein
MAAMDWFQAMTSQALASQARTVKTSLFPGTHSQNKFIRVIQNLDGFHPMISWDASEQLPFVSSKNCQYHYKCIKYFIQETWVGHK